MDIEQIPHVRDFIRERLAGKHSLRVSLVRWRAQGGRIRTEDFAALWRDEKRKLARKARQ